MRHILSSFYLSCTLDGMVICNWFPYSGVKFLTLLSLSSLSILTVLLRYPVVIIPDHHSVLPYPVLVALNRTLMTRSYPSLVHLRLASKTLFPYEQLDRTPLQEIESFQMERLLLCWTYQTEIKLRMSRLPEFLSTTCSQLIKILHMYIENSINWV